jgi:PilZ domain
MLAPASRFSKMADTGIRVPFRTHAPLILPGMLSTAGHCDQSSATLLPLIYRIAFVILSDKQDVEHRRDSRLKADQPVTVTAMGLMKMPAVAGRVLDMSGSGLRLRTPNPVPCGSPVKVESQHLTMLGEVCRCQFDGDGYVVGLMLLRSAS